MLLTIVVRPLRRGSGQFAARKQDRTCELAPHRDPHADSAKELVQSKKTQFCIRAWPPAFRRDRALADSPLEETGFEPSVPPPILRDVREESALRAAPHGFGVLNPHYLIFCPDPACHGGYQLRVPIAP